MWVNGELARASGGLEQLPLIVLSAGKEGNEEDPKLEDHERKLELHAQLARSSTRGMQVIVSKSDHLIPYEAPEAVIEAIRELVSDTQPYRFGRYNTAVNPDR